MPSAPKLLFHGSKLVLISILFGVKPPKSAESIVPGPAAWVDVIAAVFVGTARFGVVLIGERLRLG